MAGAYCRYCGSRCFVYRQVLNPGGEVRWAGHLATCSGGMAHDRASIGADHTTAHNPLDEETGECRHCARPIFRTARTVARDRHLGEGEGWREDRWDETGRCEAGELSGPGVHVHHEPELS